MSIKIKTLAALGALALTAGLGAAAGTAHAATPSCGHSCADIFSREFGTHRTPAFVIDAKQQNAATGTPVILWRTSNSDPAEDFEAEFNGTTSDFYAAGLVSSVVALHWGCDAGITPPAFPHCVGAADDPAFEIEYSPYGVGSGQCVGLAATASQGGAVTLQPCGVSSKTVWIADTTDSPATITSAYVPLINGSDTNFSHPFVLDYPHAGYPTDSPRPQLFVNGLTGFSNGTGPVVGTVVDSQLWGAGFGVLR